ncbi:YbjN domain-containing protein [Paenibacillus daejeonensis]|uniref:YbjN domain-containing protein n=1 Tax=Paenibacillus daejeonensis TaxID=135193 RepID=UPI000381245A|nr:YbjN domain-containing protein [Paenibacillus daejeonensis]
MSASDGANQIRTRFPFSFITLEGEELPVELTHLAWEDGEPEGGGNSAPPSCEITFEVGGVLATEILAKERFHLFAELVNAEPLFETEEPVVVRAKLRPSYAKLVAAGGGDSETVLAALLPDASEHAVLRQSESWLALEMMQQISLPDPLADQGTVRHGLRTAWLKAGNCQPSGAESGPSGTTDVATMALLQSQLDQLNLRYEAFSPSILQLDLTTEAGSWRMLIHASEDAGAYSVYSVFPESVPTSKHAAVAVQLMNLNYNHTGGAFELDAEDGELRYRTTVPAAAAASVDTLVEVLEAHRRIMSLSLSVDGDWSKLV